MKLNENVTMVAPAGTGRGFGGEKKADRENRMRSFWANPQNAVLFRVGRFLAQMSKEKTPRSYAQVLVDGDELTPEFITVDGKKLDLAPGSAFSLASIKSWGCVACGSAHGSGVRPSPAVSVAALARNEFYYNPTTKRLFTISDDCWGSYVVAQGAKGRFTAPTAAPVTTPKAVPAKA